jgi:hypothetical protein
MSDFTKIIKNALEYYDQNQIKYYDLTKKFKSFEVDKSDIYEMKIKFYDKKMNLILESPYQIVGKINYAQNIWIWGWSLSELTKNIIEIPRRVLNYGLDIDPENFLLKTELITSRFRVTYPIQLDTHVSIASFLSKKPFVYRLDISSDILQFDDVAKINSDKSDVLFSYYLILLNDNLEN